MAKWDPRFLLYGGLDLQTIGSCKENAILKLKERHTCRAVLVQLGFYFHMKQSLGYSRLVLTRPLVFTMCFMLFFSIVIALFKDIPDVRGDRQVSLPKHVSRAYLLLLQAKTAIGNLQRT